MAVHNAEVVHYILKAKWELDIKPSSKELLIPVGAASCSFDNWNAPSMVKCLGYNIQNDGGIRSAWSVARANMWRLFYSISRCAGWRGLTTKRKCIHIERSIWTILAFHCGTWPPQQRIAQEIDTVQRKMVAMAMSLKRKSDEDVVIFIKRRNRAAKNLCRDIGYWSHRWFKRASSWDQHLRGDLERQLDFLHTPSTQTSFAWGPSLLAFQDKEWLEDRRTYRLSTSFPFNIQTRLNVRVGRRKVHPRWSSSVAALC